MSQPDITPIISSISSNGFLQLQGQMLQLFEAAQLQAAELQQRVSELEQEISEVVWEREEADERWEAENAKLESSGYSIPRPNRQGADPARDFENALAEVARLQNVVEEQCRTIEEQEQIVVQYHERYGHAFFWGDSGSWLPENQVTFTNELVEDSAAQSFVTDDPVQEESRSATAEDRLESPAEVIDELAVQYLAEDQVSGEDATSKSELDSLRNENLELKEETETLRRQNQDLYEKNHLVQEQDKKWRKLFKKFMHRAADVQRKDTSKHQIQKGFKDLHKIVKEGELQDL